MPLYFVTLYIWHPAFIIALYWIIIFNRYNAINFKKLLILCGGVCLVIMFVFYLLPKQQPTGKNMSIAPPTLTPTPSPIPGYTVLYGTDNNVLYDSTIAGTFPGSGLMKIKTPKGMTYDAYIVGKFEGFEPINNSPDQYILLKDTYRNKQYKIRTSWESATRSKTNVMIEAVAAITSTGKTSMHMRRVGWLHDHISRFFTDHFVVAILTVNEKTNPWKPTKDTNGNYLSEWLAIR